VIGFLTVFFALYSAIHLAVYLRLRWLLIDIRLARPLVLIFFALMIVAPAASRVLEHNGHISLAKIAAWTGFLWMGFIFLALMASVLSWLAEAGLALSHRLAAWPTAAPEPRIMALIALGLALLSFFYGFFEARHLRIERLAVVTDKLPAGIESLKIAQITDLHLSLMNQVGRAAEVVALVQAEEPDIFVSTGDLVDGLILPHDELGQAFARLRPRLGKFAVMGNHEAYAGLDWSQRCLEHCGFKVLRNQVVTLGGVINIVGLDDPHAGTKPNEPALLASADQGLFTLVLKHRPEIEPATLGHFDLQLSGHAHGGQIFPFNFITRLVYPLYNGFYQLDKGSALYTSRGTGTWGPPLRILAPPEVTIVEIRPRQPAD